VICGHLRLADAWEPCALFAAPLERGPAPDPAPESPPEPEPELAVVDLLVDVGGGLAVLVAAGDRIPPALADLPRRPRDPWAALADVAVERAAAS
jgi:hypothetical protein